MKPTRLLLLLTVALAPGLLTAQTQVPARISYQGIVTDAGNALVGDPTPVNRTVIFRIWDNTTAAAQGNLVYSEEQVVTIAKGEFSVLVGAGAAVTGTPLGYSETAKGPGTVNIANAFNGSGRYLGVTVDDGTAAADTEVSPRQQIVTTAFAFRAKEAEMVIGGSINNAAIADNSVSLLKMQAGSVNSNSVVDGSIAGADILNGSITSSDLDTSTIGLWSVNGGSVYRPAGSVGIGTAAPTQMLDVAGNINASGTVVAATVNSGNVNAGVHTGGSVTAQGDVRNTGVLVKGGQPGIQLENTHGGNGWNLWAEDQGDLYFLKLGANPNYTMTLAATGNVGIGTQSPATKLHVIKPGGAWPATSGNTQSAGHLMRMEDGSNAVLDFGSFGGNGHWLQSTDRSAFNLNYPLLLNPNGGNVGIGTTSPSDQLHVSGGNIRVSGSNKVLSVADSGNVVRATLAAASSGGAFHGLSAVGDAILRAETGKLFFQSGGTGTAIVISTDNNVGIGTATPGTKLDVSGAIGGQSFVFQGDTDTGLAYNSANLYTLLANGTGALEIVGRPGGSSWVAMDTGGNPIAPLNVDLTVSNSAGGGNVSDNTSIAAQGNVLALAHTVYSDARIKNIIGRSEGAADLKTLLGIEITDYTFKDVNARGAATQKKVIAQQVEKVYPQAIAKSTSVVPDIYKEATIKDGWVKLATDLKKGERVKLTAGREKRTCEVLEVKGGAFRTEFQPVVDKVFVYGREVNDFRNVDYEAISMLNVSATQELARQLEEQKKENAGLKERLASLEAKDKARDAKLAAIEQRLTAAAPAAETVSLKTAPGVE